MSTKVLFAPLPVVVQSEEPVENWREMYALTASLTIYAALSASQFQIPYASHVGTEDVEVLAIYRPLCKHHQRH